MRKHVTAKVLGYETSPSMLPVLIVLPATLAQHSTLVGLL